MKKILAVSGGLDSMVLLHQFKDDEDVIVAHFNHGTRPSATDDQLFVKCQAGQYHKPFFTATTHLGEHASEERARAARYNFLRQLAKKHQAQIFTAHHADDLLETIVINLFRGTGWRGLTPFGQTDICRPLLHQTKNQLRVYAAEHNIIYREDPTNNEPQYLRNRLRQALVDLSPTTKSELLQLARRQAEIKTELAATIQDLLPADDFYPRSWFAELDDDVALEILRVGLAKKSYSATRPKLQDFLQAIRTYTSGKQFNLPDNHLIKIHKDHFVIK